MHRNVHQQLAQAMTVHYFVGTGWSLRAFEPNATDLRRDGTSPPNDPPIVMTTLGNTGICHDTSVIAVTPAVMPGTLDFDMTLTAASLSMPATAHIAATAIGDAVTDVATTMTVP